MNKYLKQLLEALAQKNASANAILTKSLDAGSTPDEAQEAEIAEIEKEIAEIEKNISRVRRQIDATEKAAKTATPVAGENEGEAAKSAAGDPDPARIVVKSNLPKGNGFAMMVKASAVAARSGGQVTASDILKQWNAPEIVQKALVQKALIGATTEATFGAALVDYQNLTGEFIELLRQKTVIDRLAPDMRQVPFNIKLPSQTSASSVGWVGEKQMKPVTNPTYGSVTMTKSKVAGIVLLSEELVRFSNPKADGLVRDDLVKSTAEFIDDQFFDPTKAETDESPASILNGATAIPSSGTTPAQIDADLVALVNQLTDAGVSLEGARWVMSATRAASMSTMRDALGNKYWEGMSLTGERSLMGLVVETSGAAADIIALVVPSEIMLADDGVVDFSVSTEATINLGTEAAPNWISLYQNNLMAIRGERFIRWKKRNGNAAGYIQY